MLRRRRLWTIWGRPRKRRDSNRNSKLSKIWLIDRFLNWWRCEINRNRFSTNKLLRQRVRPLNYSRRRRGEGWRWRQQLRKAERTRLIDCREKRMQKREKNWSLLSSGNWGTRSWQLQNNRSERRRDNVRLKSLIIWRNSLRRRTTRLRKNSSWTSTWLWGTRDCRISRRRTSTRTLRSVWLSGRIRGRMWSLWSWSWRTTRNESSDQLLID
jgi:hypothetical protein